MSVLRGKAARAMFLPGLLLLGACNTQTSAPTTPSPGGGADATPASSTTTEASRKDLSVAELLASPKPALPSAPPSSTAPSGTASTTVQSNSADAPVAVGDAAIEPRSTMPVDESAFARVVSVQAIPGPRQICTEQTIVERRHPGDRHHVAGTVIGAIVGGVVGSRIGRGSGRTVATVGGAVAGGAVGREIQRNNEGRDTVTRVVTHCRPAHGAEAGVALYDVIYAYQGQNFHVRLDHDPGDRIALPVRGVE